MKSDSPKTSPRDSTNLERSSQLAGKVAVVTGASSGIGEATVRELTRLGASVVMTARRFDRLKAIATEIEASGGRAYPLATDATQASDLSGWWKLQRSNMADLITRSIMQAFPTRALL